MVLTVVLWYTKDVLVLLEVTRNDEKNVNIQTNIFKFIIIIIVIDRSETSSFLLILNDFIFAHLMQIIAISDFYTRFQLILLNAEPQTREQLILLLWHLQYIAIPILALEADALSTTLSN